MRISDWSSDVCSSDLSDDGGTAKLASQFIGSREVERQDMSRTRPRGRYTTWSMSMQTRRAVEDVVLPSEIMQLPDREGLVKRAGPPPWRPEERRVGNEGVSLFSSRGLPHN